MDATISCQIMTLMLYCSPAKPSKPSRAYLHLTKQEHITSLSEKIHNTTFIDGKASSKDSSLLGPPSVEFTPYGRVPNSRPRKDARQGTIDQDPEFIDFLESLTNPIAKPAPADQENEAFGKSKEKVTVTPLIQFLKDKKANKGKDTASPAKSAKHTRQDSKESKPSTGAENKAATTTVAASSPKKRSAQAVKVEQAARDAVKILNKQAASKGGATATQPLPPVVNAPTVVPNSTANAALAEKRRERGNASAAAKILQRDLGLDKNAGGRGGRRGLPGNASRAVASNTTAATEQATPANPSPTQAGTTSTAAKDTVDPPSNGTAKPPVTQPPLGPAASRNAARVSTPISNTSSGSPKVTPPSSTSTQAFLKHANPSQGITEPLLDEAFAVFGTINKVEIDKKKGFAYVDFADPAGLQKAIKASPIKVGQGQVVVLERKTRPTLQARNMRGGGQMMGNRGGGMPVGGRGGSMRGRGSFGRGANMPNVNNNARQVPPIAPASSTQGAATTQNATTATAPTNESSAPSSNPAPAPSVSTDPAD